MKTPKFVRKKYNSMLLAYLFTWFVATFGDLADGIIAGAFLGEEAAAAVELVTPLLSIFMFFCSFIAIGISSSFTRSMGEFDQETAYKTSGMGLLAALICGALLSGTMYVFEDALFRFYTSPPAVEAYARQYYECLIVLAFVYPLYWTVDYMISADGDASLCLIAAGANAVTNALFSILLLDQFGIAGLGLGTVIALFIGGGVLATHFFKKTNSLKFKIGFEPEKFREAVIIGSTSSLTYLYVGVVDIVMNKFLVLHFGDAADSYLAAYLGVNLVLNLAGCFCCAGSACRPFVCVGYGEKNSLAIKNIMRRTTVSISIIGVALALAVALAAPLLPNLVGITDPVAFRGAVYAGRILAISYIPTCFVVHWTQYLPQINQSLQSNVLAAIYMLIAPLVFPIPFTVWWEFKGLVWGFFLTPVVAYIYHFVYVTLKYGIKKFPYMIEDSDDKIFIHEFTANEQNVICLRDAVEKDLISCGVDSKIINKAQVLLEESLLIVRDKNPGKLILGDCTVIVSDKYVRLITRDNGVIFDITDVDSKIKTLREYMNACLNDSDLESKYLVTTSFNRNSYIWER